MRKEQISFPTSPDQELKPLILPKVSVWESAGKACCPPRHSPYIPADLEVRDPGARGGLAPHATWQARWSAQLERSEPSAARAAAFIRRLSAARCFCGGLGHVMVSGKLRQLADFSIYFDGGRTRARTLDPLIKSTKIERLEIVPDHFLTFPSILTTN